MPSTLATTLQAAAISAVSNVIAQFLEAYREQRPFSLDLANFARFIILTFITAPPNHYWQQLLERAFPGYDRRSRVRDPEKDQPLSDDAGTGPGSASGGGDDASKPKLNLRNTVTKWFVDCMTLGALMNTVAFLLLMGIMKGQPREQIARSIRNETIPIIFASYKIWPIASIISFSFVPADRRVVFLSFVGLLWGIYMSLVAARV